MTRKPEILAIGMLPPPIGGQAVMFEAAIAELARSACVDVIDIQAQRNIGEYGKLHAGKVAWLLRLVAGQLLPRRRRRYDVLYYLPAGPNRLGLIKDIIILALIRKCASRTVYHFHATGIGALIAQQPAPVRRLAERVLFGPDVAIRCANLAPDDAALFRARRSAVVANAVPDPLGPYRGRTRPSGGPLRLAFIGAMVEKKGIFDLIDVAGILQAQGCDFVMHFVGEGLPADLARFNRLIAQRGLANRIVRHGILTGPSKYDLMFECDVLLFPSYWASETQPLVVIEAHAMGLPAVACDIGGIRTIIRDGESGYVVPLRDTRAFAAAILALRDRQRARAMGAAGRQQYEAMFTMQRFVTELRQAVLS